MQERVRFFRITAVEDRMPLEERRNERHACVASCSISLLVNCDVTERSLDCPENFGANWIVRSPSTMRDAVLRSSGGGNWISASTRTNYQDQTGGRRIVEAANTSANIRGSDSSGGLAQ